MLKQRSPVFFRSQSLAKFRQSVEPVVKSKKTRSYFTLTITFFALSFFILFAIRPTLLTAINLKRNVSDLEKLNIDYESKISNIIQAQIAYENIREQMSLVNQALPSYSSFHTLARRIEEFASQSNVSIDQFSIDPVPISLQKSTGKYETYGFAITSVGTYNNIFDFLSHLLNWRRIVNVENLELSRQSGTISGQLRMSIRAKTYYEP